jgi:tetratricopeptide (TPR) repeat protein
LSKLQVLLLVLSVGVTAAWPAPPQSATQRELTVVVVNAHSEPSQPVQGVRVSLTFVAGAEKVVDARDATNRTGQALLLVSPEAAQRGDLRIEVTGASELVVFEPADGELNGLPATVTIKLIPKGSPALLGPAQIEAMLHRLSLQNKHLEQANREVKGELAAAQSQKPDDLTAAMREWATANGFAVEDADKQVHQWAEEIQQRKDQATADQQALAELALKHYGAAAQLFDKAADDIGESMDEDEKRFLENRRKQLLEYVDKKFQSANTYALNLQYRQATQILEQTRDRAAAEHGRYPEDAALRSIWLEAISRAAGVRVAEGEIAPAAESRALLSTSVEDFRNLLHEYAAPEQRQSWAGMQSDLGVTLVDLAERSNGAQQTELLAQAVEAHRAALQARSKADTPWEWAATQLNLAAALLRQGEVSQGAQATGLLAQAATAYRAALQVFTKADTPQVWAMTQTGLGVILERQAERSSGTQGTDLLAQAIEAYRAALEVQTEAELPKDWASTQLNLGTALTRQSERASAAQATELLSQGIAAFRAALRVFANADMPQVQARVQFNLGTALIDQGQRSSGAQGTEALAQAVEAFKAVLEVFTKTDLPQDWATAQNNLGNALVNQGERTSDAPAAELFMQAVQAYKAALEVFTKTDLPQNWANTMDNLGLALTYLGARGSGAQSEQFLAQATQAYRDALEVFTKSDLPQDWASAQSHLGIAMMRQSERTGGAQAIDLLAQAAQAYRATLEVYTKASQPQNWADSQNNLSIVLSDQAVRSSGTQAADLLAQAVQADRAALEVYTKSDLPFKWASTQNNLGLSLSDLAQQSSAPQATELLAQAVAAFQAALEIRTKADLPLYWATTEKNLGETYQLQGDSTAAAAALESSLELLPTDLDLMEHLSNVDHEHLFRFDRALEVDQRRTQIDPSIGAKLDLEEANLTADRFDGCVEEAGALQDPNLSAAGSLIRDTIKLACQWGAGKKSETFANQKALLLQSATLQEPAWVFTGTLHYLAASAVFEKGRASWIALFESVQKGDGAAMGTALNQLEEALKN